MSEEVISLAERVGANILAKRKMRGLTQAALAERIGVEQQSLSRMENGKIAPRFERLECLAASLHCSVAELFMVPAQVDNHMAAIADMLGPLSFEGRQTATRIMGTLTREIFSLETALAESKPADSPCKADAYKTPDQHC